MKNKNDLERIEKMLEKGKFNPTTVVSDRSHLLDWILEYLESDRNEVGA